MADCYTPSNGGEYLPDPAGPLTPSEDAEIRRLYWMTKSGRLSERSHKRLSELRHRDRRQTIREPTEFQSETRPAEKQKSWGRLRAWIQSG